jgi:polyhydroxyalkanoate synthesis repressor PhaR
MVQPPVTIKKYGNRRLYDTEHSCYLTLEELAAKIRRGADVRVVDAKTEEDITQETLAQLVFEGNSARLLPTALLLQLIRIGDDAMADFFGHYVSWALEMYLQSKRGAQTLAQLHPVTGGFPSWSALSQIPSVAVDALQRMWMANPLMQLAAPNAASKKTSVRPAANQLDDADPRSDIDELRRELAELRNAVAADRETANRKRPR